MVPDGADFLSNPASFFLYLANLSCLQELSISAWSCTAVIFNLWVRAAMGSRQTFTACGKRGLGSNPRMDHQSSWPNPHTASSCSLARQLLMPVLHWLLTPRALEKMQEVEGNGAGGAMGGRSGLGREARLVVGPPVSYVSYLCIGVMAWKRLKTTDVQDHFASFLKIPNQFLWGLCHLYFQRWVMERTRSSVVYWSVLNQG